MRRTTESVRPTTPNLPCSLSSTGFPTWSREKFRSCDPSRPSESETSSRLPRSPEQPSHPQVDINHRVPSRELHVLDRQVEATDARRVEDNVQRSSNLVSLLDNALPLILLCHIVVIKRQSTVRILLFNLGHDRFCFFSLLGEVGQDDRAGACSRETTRGFGTESTRSASAANTRLVCLFV